MDVRKTAEAVALDESVLALLIGQRQAPVS
jgi:hypothetical protein